MIPFNPLNPSVPIRAPIKVIPTNRIAKRNDNNNDEPLERRKSSDRRRQPFRHRGQFEMRKGRDRRDDAHINEQI